MPWILRGLSNGVITSKYPKKMDSYGDSHHSSVKVQTEYLASRDTDLEGLCPTGAIRVELGRPRIDLGQCILCGHCVDRAPEIFSFSTDFETARLSRDLLVVPPSAESTGELANLKSALADRVRRFGNSVALRHIDCGSDGSEEWEIAALTNPVYDVQRLGITFTASPRHADILLVTGAGAKGMSDSLKETYHQMAEPKVVVAVGTDAISGGTHSNSAAVVAGGIEGVLPVDVFVPGSPPSPFGILYGILLAMGIALDGGAST